MRQSISGRLKFISAYFEIQSVTDRDIWILSLSLKHWRRAVETQQTYCQRNANKYFRISHKYQRKSSYKSVNHVQWVERGGLTHVIWPWANTVPDPRLWDFNFRIQFRWQSQQMQFQFLEGDCRADDIRNMDIGIFLCLSPRRPNDNHEQTGRSFGGSL